MGDNPAPVKAPKRVVRKYDPEYIKFGFIMAGSDAAPKGQCVECGEILSNEALKQLKLQRDTWVFFTPGSPVFVTSYTFDPISFGFTLQLCERTKELYMTYLCPVVITYVGCISLYLTGDSRQVCV